MFAEQFSYKILIHDSKERIKFYDRKRNCAKLFVEDKFIKYKLLPTVS